MKYATFRSGNANGADLYFSQGVASVNKQKLEVVIPFDGHRSKSNLAGHTLSLDQIDLVAYPDIIAMSALNKKTKDLLKRYLTGERNRFTRQSLIHYQRYDQSYWSHGTSYNQFCNIL
jgi:hypothetical protein